MNKNQSFWHFNKNKVSKLALVSYTCHICCSWEVQLQERIEDVAILVFLDNKVNLVHV